MRNLPQIQTIGRHARAVAAPVSIPLHPLPAGYEWTPRNRNENMSFEDMMAKFKQSSDDKMSDLKKYMDVKGGSRRGK